MLNREFVSFKKFVEQRKAVNESIINEGLLDTIKSVIKKVGDWFTGKGSHFLNLLKLQEDKKLPGKVKIIPSASDVEIMKTLDDKFKTSSIPKIKVNENLSESEFEEFISKLNEDAVQLHYDKATNIGKAQLLKKIKLSIETKMPILIWGAPGIGKTSLVNEVVELRKARLEDVPLSTMVPEDFAIPSIDKETKTATRYPLDWLPVYHVDEGKAGNERVNGPDGKGGVLFLDELTRAHETVLNVCLKLINERRMGNYILGSEWAIICAANRQEDDPNSKLNVDLTALDNRVKHYNYVPEASDWADWAESKKTTRKKKVKDEEGNIVDKEVEELLIDPSIPAFLRFQSKYFHYLDHDNYSHAWPSPRSWAEAGKEIMILKKMADEDGEPLDMEDVETSVKATVGNAAGAEFIAFLKIMRSLDTSKIKYAWSDPKKALTLELDKSNHVRPDIGHAIVSSVMYEKHGKKLTEKEVVNILEWIKMICQTKGATQDSTVYGNLALKMLINDHEDQLNPVKNPEVLKDPTFLAFSKEVSELYKAVPALDPKKQTK